MRKSPLTARQIAVLSVLTGVSLCGFALACYALYLLLFR